MKAGGRDRLLLVDGHNSHYTRGFLEYARTQRIHVLCYPSHTTHVYQGLDVVVFSVLKRAIGEERDMYERSTGEKMNKQNFLKIYGAAHLRVLTPALIKTAFRKTGVWPYDPSVITEAMMAPSKETSCEGYLPIVPPTPIRIVAKLLRDFAQLELKDDLDSGPNSDSDVSVGGEDDRVLRRKRTTLRRAGSSDAESDVSSDHESDGEKEALPHGDPTAAIKEAVQRLAESSLESLIGSYPSRLGETARTLIPRTPAKPKQTPIYHHPMNARELQLAAALREAEAQNTMYRRRMLELQATNILHESYCKQLREQLAFKDEKKGKPKGKGKLMGNGLPVLLTGDFFYEKVVEFEKDQRRKEKEKADRVAGKADRDQVVKDWEKEVEERQKAVEDRRAAWGQEKRDWAEKKVKWASDKAAGRVKGRFMMLEPKLGKLPPHIPKPKANSLLFEASDTNEEVDNEREDEVSGSD